MALSLQFRSPNMPTACRWNIIICVDQYKRALRLYFPLWELGRESLNLPSYLNVIHSSHSLSKITLYFRIKSII